MDHFEEIIGYSEIKTELRRIADVLQGHEAYQKLGVKSPRGLLLHGDPGVGKTLMASCLVKASGRPCFMCRKDRPDGEFVDAIRETFDKAKTAAPSIVFLDDMDKFANEDMQTKDAEEYVTVQSCIDELKGHEVFVLATVNSIHELPDSLLRAGRFDRVIEVDLPDQADAAEIICHYMSSRNFSAEIDAERISRIIAGRSCAELETIINEAGLYAGFERSGVITEEHFLKACLHIVFEVPIEKQKSLPNEDMKKRAAYHEAGHAVMQELLAPGSVTLISLYSKRSNYNGFIAACMDPCVLDTLQREKISILVNLSGIAAEDQILGNHGCGGFRDIDDAFSAVKGLLTRACTSGFRLHSLRGQSDTLVSEQETAVAAEVERYFRRSKEILAAHSEFLHHLAKKLMERELLGEQDVESIKTELGIKALDPSSLYSF